MALAVGLVFSAYIVKAETVVTNDGFEYDLQGWNPVINNAGSATITNAAHSGLKALRIVTSPTRSSVYLYQNLPLIPKSYNISVWLRFEKSGQEIALSSGWIPERGLGLALRLIVLPGTPEWEIQLQGGGQTEFAKWLYWGIQKDRWYNFRIVSDDFAKKRTLYIDGQEVIEVGLTQSIIPNMIFIGYCGKEHDESDYHPPTYKLGGSSVIWDDISITSYMSPDLEDLIQIVSQLEQRVVELDVFYQQVLAHVSDFNTSLVNLTQDVGRLQQELATLGQSLVDTQESIDRLWSENSNIRTQLQALSNEVNQLQSKLSIIETNLLSFTTQTLQEIEAVNSTLSRMLEELNTSTTARFSNLEDLLGLIRDTIDALSSQVRQGFDESRLRTSREINGIQSMINVIGNVTLRELEQLSQSLASNCSYLDQLLETLNQSLRNQMQSRTELLSEDIGLNREMLEEGLGSMNASSEDRHKSVVAAIQELKTQGTENEKQLRTLIYASIVLGAVAVVLSIMLIAQGRRKT